MLKIIRLLYTFYLSHFFIGLCISVSCSWLYSKLGNHAIPTLCWFKAITMGIFCYAINKNKHKEFFYYQNLGISKQLLWGVTLGIDLILFILIMVLTNKFNGA